MDGPMDPIGIEILDASKELLMANHQENISLKELFFTQLGE